MANHAVHFRLEGTGGDGTSERTAFVGHKASELEGARAVGMKTIAFNYENSAKADFYIRRFSDLLKLPVIA